TPCPYTTLFRSPLAVHRVTPELDQLPAHMAAGHGNHLNRQWENPQVLHPFAVVGDTDKLTGHGGDDFLPGEGRTAPLDQLQSGVDLVGTVHVEDDFVHGIEVEHGNAQGLEALGRGRGAGHSAGKLVFVSGEQVNKEIGGGAGADTDNTLLVDFCQCVVNGGGGHCLLDVVLGHG